MPRESTSSRTITNSNSLPKSSATRPAAAGILATMFVATFLKQAGAPYLERELSLLFGAVALCFLVAGSGWMAGARGGGAERLSPRVRASAQPSLHSRRLGG